MSGAQEAVRFAGYAALFNRLDQGGDVIAPGAFAASLARTGEVLPLLWQHRADQQIGQMQLVREDGGIRPGAGGGAGDQPDLPGGAGRQGLPGGYAASPADRDGGERERR